MILVYTGLGKGKTCACVGQALRALGQNLRVAFGQFIKRSGQSGEQLILQKLLGENYLASGLGFIKEGSFLAHKAKAQELLAWSFKRLPNLQMLILDEICLALHYELLSIESVQNLIDQAKNCHLVFSGRFAPNWLIAQADFVTIMNSLKHPYSKGIKAQPGIEY